MNTVTTPRKLVGQNNLMAVPRKEYEAFSRWQKMFRTFKPTAKDIAELKRARANYRAGRVMTIHELRQKLAGRN